MSFAGIDLGTCTSGIAIMGPDGMKMVDFDLGCIVPSYVCYKGAEIICGHAAKNDLIKTTGNVIYDAKRLIGRKFTDKAIQEDLKHWLFKVVDDGKGDPVIEIKTPLSVKKFTPIDVSADLLKYLIRYASEKAGNKIDSVVITVPANFNNAQREATKLAGEKAGVEVMAIMNEPTAAAYAYGFQRDRDVGKKTILVYDFGGGTFDVSIIEVTNGEIKLLGSSGDPHLGGRDIDQRMADHFADIYKKATGEDLKKDAKKLRKLMSECERRKVELSENTEISIELEYFEDAGVEDTSLTRANFERLCKDIFDLTIEKVRSTIEDTGLTIDNINDVVLVGGSSRIPIVTTMLTNMFTKAKINRDINPDEAVTMGAGLNAQQIYIEKHQIPLEPGMERNMNDGRGKKVLVKQNDGRKVLIPAGKKVLVSDIVNISFGLRGDNPLGGRDLMKKILCKNDPLTKIGIDYFISQPFSSDAYLDIYEGESDYADDNNLVKSYHFSGFTSKADGTIIEVKCTTDPKTSIMTIEGNADGKVCKVEVNIAGHVDHG